MFLALLLTASVSAQGILGSMADYAAMAGGTLTINGVGTTINGNVGSTGAIAGPGSNYTVTGGSVVTTTTQNQTDFARAYAGLAGMAATADLSGLILGTTAGATILTPGVYTFTSTAQLTGMLTLDAQNQSNAVWVFQVGSTFTSAADSSVVFANLAANSSVNNGVFWQVGSTVVLGADTVMEGNLLANTSIVMSDGASIAHGRALTGVNTMTLDGNAIDFGAPNAGYSGGLAFADAGNTITAVPEPAAASMLAGLAILGLSIIRRGNRRS